MKLFTYFRSSAAYRVRIALNLKNIGYQAAAVHLAKGQHKSQDFKTVNAQMRLPALELPGGEVLTQSLAIMDYLEEMHPQPPLLPSDPVARAQVRAVAQIVACDIHPLNNLMTLNYLKNTLKHDKTEIDTWYHHWVLEAFESVESLIHPSPYAFGSSVTLADVCLVPQVFNARRFNVPLDRFPKIVAADAACAKLPAFDKARPENQPDAE